MVDIEEVVGAVDVDTAISSSRSSTSRSVFAPGHVADDRCINCMVISCIDMTNG